MREAEVFTVVVGVGGVCTPYGGRCRESAYTPLFYLYLLLGGAPHKREENMRCWHVAKSLGAPPAAGDGWYALFTAPGECPLRYYQPNPPFHDLMVTGWPSTELPQGRTDY